MLAEIKIRKAIATDFEALDRFDIFAGDRKVEIAREEYYLAVRENLFDFFSLLKERILKTGKCYQK